MEKLQITCESESPEGAIFSVTIGEDSESTHHLVKVEKSYAQETLSWAAPLHKLIEASFKFLLAREPKESILREFNLDVISQYFREYENTMRSLTNKK